MADIQEKIVLFNSNLYTSIPCITNNQSECKLDLTVVIDIFR
jgi:hypothetical protein